MAETKPQEAEKEAQSIFMKECIFEDEEKLSQDNFVDEILRDPTEEQNTSGGCKLI